MRLVYLAPVPYSSSYQRSHHFVDFFNRNANGGTLWINPYPGRFPQYKDIRRGRLRVYERIDESVKVLSPPTWIAEPALRTPLLRRIIWKSIFDHVAAFVDGAEWSLVIGRPSLLALQLIQETHPSLSCYDAMDDFPEFYHGAARTFHSRIEAEISHKVDRILVSSITLQKKFKLHNISAELVRNGINVSHTTIQPKFSGRKIFGYVGTIAGWFDWDLIIRMASALPEIQFDLIGPEIAPSKKRLPRNVFRLGECASEDVPHELHRFTAGIIPFKINRLTASVDPIKYYEYRAAGLPVISTRFGAMCRRGPDENVYLIDKSADFRPVLDDIVNSPNISPDELEQFQRGNSWQSRFEGCRFFHDLLSCELRQGVERHA